MEFLLGATPLFPLETVLKLSSCLSVQFFFGVYLKSLTMIIIMSSEYLPFRVYPLQREKAHYFENRNRSPVEIVGRVRD